MVLLDSGMICPSCLHRACYVTKPPAQFVKWCCRKKRVSFGTDEEYKSGKNQVTKCADYLEKFDETKQEVVIPKDAKVARNIERLKEAVRK